MNWVRAAIVAAVLAAFAAAGGALRTHWIHAGEARVQTRWDAQSRADLSITLELERERSRDQLLRMKNAERNADEQSRLAELRKVRDAAVARELDGLRNTITALNQRELPSTCDATCVEQLAREATAARELLGSCAARYRELAAEAEELRDQVIGLQADAANVCRAHQPINPTALL